MYLQFLTYCAFIGYAYGIIGENVKYANIGECPYVVSISAKPVFDHAHGNLHFCTGTLISERSVLTAAHCLKNKQPSEVEIIAGSKNLVEGKRYMLERWITYDQWNNTNNIRSLNDIAVIILKGEGIKDIKPADLSKLSKHHLDSRTVKILGWGNLKNGQQPIQLRKAILFVISNTECSALGTRLRGTNFVVPPNYFCSKAEPFILSSCGDGGAPLLIGRNYLIGINIGACPRLHGNYDAEFLHQNLLNAHLHLHRYGDFINDVAGTVT